MFLGTFGGVDIRTIQLMLGHADIKQTQRYLNITDEELRKSLTGVWERRRQLRLAGQPSRPEATGEQAVATSPCAKLMSWMIP